MPEAVHFTPAFSFVRIGVSQTHAWPAGASRNAAPCPRPRPSGSGPCLPTDAIGPLHSPFGGSGSRLPGSSMGASVMAVPVLRAPRRSAVLFRDKCVRNRDCLRFQGQAAIWRARDAACRSAPTPAPLRRPASSHGQGGVSHPRLLLQQLPEAQLCRGVPRHSGRLPPAPAHKVGSRYHIQRRICGCMEFVVCILHRLGLEGLLSLRKHAARLSRMGCTRNTPHTLPHPRPRLYPTQHSPAAACRWGPTPPAASWC